MKADSLEALLGKEKTEQLFRLLPAREAGQFLGLAEQTVRDMTYRHELPCVKVGVRGVRYRLIDLILWAERRAHPATQG
jgi:hypothetical protein